MTKRHPALGLGAAVTLIAAGLLSLAAPAAAGASPPAASACASGRTPAAVGHLRGIVRAQPLRADCRVHNAGDPAIGDPPLIFHGGAVMGTQSTGQVVITPIFWSPKGHPIPSAYEDIINTYLAGVAAASGQTTNVFSVATEYSGSNGTIRYQIARGSPITDTGRLPASGCKLSTRDKTQIYADGSGYNACIDDSQIMAETSRVVTANGLPRNDAHIYVMFLPRQVESCTFSGSTTTTANGCTINHEPSAAFCAYHSEAPDGTIYGNLPFPIYASPTGFTCGSDGALSSVEAPNGNLDADTEVSLISHEVMEAITDPDTSTGWYDIAGFEIADECAYVYGATQGQEGQLYNQVINQRHYLTQEEFSNRNFAKKGGGCLQSE
jgi:hypothetical protein